MTSDSDNQDIYALDKWLRKLGIYHRRALPTDMQERRAALEEIDFSQPFHFAGGNYGRDNQLLDSVTSTTSYDPETGIFEDRIIYYRHLPWSNTDTDTAENGEHYTIAIRGRRDDSHTDADGIPEIVPDQVFVNGQQVFNGTIQGGGEDPYWPVQRRRIESVLAFSRRVKEALQNNDSTLDMAQILSGGDGDDDLLKAIAGSGTYMRGLSKDGGTEQMLDAFFLGLHQQEPDQMEEFVLRNDAAGTAVDKLKVLHGHNINTMEPMRELGDACEESDTNLSSGVRYVGGSYYDYDEQRQRHVFRHTIGPEDPPPDMDPADRYELIRLEYEQVDDETFRRTYANFMEGDPARFRDWRKARQLTGAYIGINNHLAGRRYAPYYDIIYDCGLNLEFDERQPPHDTPAGETAWIPLHGASMEVDTEDYGAGIGGGNAITNRVWKDDHLSESMVLVGMPWEIGGPDSRYDGAQPDITRFHDGLGNGVILLDHRHFDHATLQYYAKMGMLKGQRVICRKDVREIVQDELKNLEVPRRDWPDFVTYDHPEMRQIDNYHYAYPVRDDDGDIRHWVQICEYGAKHSALTDLFCITPCQNDGHYQPGYFFYNDAYDLHAHGWDFAANAPMALAELDEVDEAALRQSVTSEEERYIAFHDPTNCDHPGSAANQYEEFKDTARTLIGLFPDSALLWFSFATNHLERQAIWEVTAEQDTLRNTTTAGASAERSDTVMNTVTGVDPFLDLRAVEIDHDKLPQAAYDTVLDALETYVANRRADAKKRAQSTKNNKDYKQHLAEDDQHSVFNYVLKRARDQKRKGHDKPPILYDAFFNGSETPFEDMAEKAGLARQDDKPRKMPNFAYNAIDAIRKEDKKAYDGDPQASTRLWMLKSLVKNGCVRFETKNNIADYKMYQAILAGMETASRHGTRNADFVKAFRNDPGHLLVSCTGATGSIQEDESQLSRYARGESLLDYDETVRPTAYKLDRESVPRVLWVSQTASMGDNAKSTQRKLISDIVENRDDTVIQSIQDGLIIHNPGRHHEALMQHLHEAGWTPRYDAAANEIKIHGITSHIHGHGFAQDLQKMVNNLKAISHEFIHIPAWRNFIDGCNMVRRAGQRTLIETPKNWVNNVLCRDAGNGEPEMQQRDQLSIRRWTFTLKRPHRQQYGGSLEATMNILRRTDGCQRDEGLDVRTQNNGEFKSETANIPVQEFQRSAAGKDARQRKETGPGTTDVKTGNTRRKARNMGAYIAQQLRLKAG